MQLANEFGLLASLGYSKGFLTAKTLLEAGLAVVFSWLLGLGLSELVLRVMNEIAFKSRGIEPMTALTQRVINFTIPIPIAVAVFSVTIVIWQLWRLDPVSVIERRD